MNVNRTIKLLMHLRRNGITQTDVLSAMERVPREMFIPQNFQDRAYDDTALPIGHGQTISQPLVVATMTQELELNDRATVLEIGTGSGYQTTILSQLCRRVYTIERLKPLQEVAQRRFDAMKLRNVTTLHGDGYKGWPSAAPFDRIIVTAGANQEPPQALLDQLSDNGILIIPIKKNAIQEELIKIRKIGGTLTREHLMDVRFVPLVSEHDIFTAGQRR
ncbi:MAG TPA: protein-L-isoaspartate(D-aspartate) O-methyltransferase [Alphaproteobacteria bacterium]